MSVLDDDARRDAFDFASHFREDLYACLTARGDTLFELCDAMLCENGPVTSPVDLTLLAEHRRGHGALYDALNHGRIDETRLRRALATLPQPKAVDGRLVLAVDVSAWLRPDAPTSPDRLFCHVYGRWIRVTRPVLAAGQAGLWADLAAGLKAVRAAPDVLVVIVTFVLALALTSGLLTVGLVAVVGQGGRYGLLLGVAGVAEVAGALLLAGLRMRRLALAAVLAWALLGIFRAPLGIVTSTTGAAVLLIATGLASALTDIPLIALVQQRIPSHHLAKALGLWEAGVAGALAVSPFVASTTIALTGVKDAFLLSGAALVVLAMTAALSLARTARGRRPGQLRIGVPSGSEAEQPAVTPQSAR